MKLIEFLSQSRCGVVDLEDRNCWLAVHNDEFIVMRHSEEGLCDVLVKTRDEEEAVATLKKIESEQEPLSLLGE